MNKTEDYSEILKESVEKIVQGIGGNCETEHVLTEHWTEHDLRKKIAEEIKTFAPAILKTIEERTREELINKVDNIMDIEGAKDLKESLKTFGHESCPICGYDPIHQREYMMRELDTLNTKK